jgi:GTP-binding protein EngB required for normal cell division
MNVLAGLAPHLNVIDLDQLGELEHRLRRGRLRILVVGEAGRGKSTLVNALLGRPVLPAGVTPLTSLPAILTFGPDEHADVTFTDGRRELRPLDDLADLVTESGNPGNKRGVARVVVELDDPLLARGVELVDMPGTGQIPQPGTTAADFALESIDAAVFVLTAEPPVSAAERALLDRIAGSPIALFAVLNKIDRLDPREREEAVTSMRDLVGEQVRLYPLSALDADPGFDGFAADFMTYLDRERNGDLQASVARHAEALARRRLDEVRLALRMDEMRDGQAAERLTRFRERLAAVRARRGDAADIVRGEGQRLVADLNDSADLVAGDMIVQLRADLTGYLARDHGTAAETGQRGRDRAAGFVRTEVDSWRTRWQRRLSEDLAALDAQLLADLDQELTDVRAAALRLLDLELAIPPSQEHLIADPRFFYDYAEPAGRADPPAGAVRRRLPGALGRGRAREHVLREAADLAAHQIDRCRADLQYRLAESIRQLIRAIEARYDDTGARLLAVVDGGARESRQTSAAHQVRRAALEREAAELAELLDELEDLRASMRGGRESRR